MDAERKAEVNAKIAKWMGLFTLHDADLGDGVILVSRDADDWGDSFCIDYFTDRAASMEVLENLAELRDRPRGWIRFDISTCAPSKRPESPHFGAKFQVQIWGDYLPSRWFSREHLPEAIALAAEQVIDAEAKKGHSPQLN